MSGGIEEADNRKGKFGPPGLFEALRRELRLRNYSPKTIKSYCSHLRAFVAYEAPKHPKELSEDDVRRYLLHLIEEKHFSAGSVSQVMSSIKFLYSEVYDRPFVTSGLPRPIREHKLPVVLSIEEVKRVFESLGNLKHRIMLMLVYSAGLRVGEVVRLRPEDIDSDRMMIHVRQGKGKKDRYTVLSEVVLEGLREYWKAYRPKRWLFEGQEEGKPYSIRSAERVFEIAAK